MTKIALQPKIGLVKKEKTQQAQLPQKEPKKRTKNCAQTTKNNLAQTQSHKCMPLEQPCFNQPYLPRFNSKLKSV